MLNKRVVIASCAAFWLAIGVSSASAQTFEGPKEGKGLRINVLGEVDRPRFTRPVRRHLNPKASCTGGRIRAVWVSS